MGHFDWIRPGPSGGVNFCYE